jgi:hypothetical protein
MCELLSSLPSSRVGRVALLGPVGTVGKIGAGRASLIVSIPVVCGGFVSWCQQFLSVCIITNMTESIRMPASVASRKALEAARLVVESVAETAMGRSTKLNLEEMCSRLEINVADVRARAQQLRDASCRRTQ